MKAYIERLFAQDAYKINVRSSSGKISGFLKGKLEWEFIENEATFKRDDLGIVVSAQDFGELAQAIQQAAIEAGLLPDTSKIEGELEATKRHLQDLQKAFNKLLESK